MTEQETIDYEELYANFSNSQDFSNFDILVTDYYLPQVQIYFPVHAITLGFMLFMLWSLATNPYLHSRPKNLFLISCFFFTIGAGYNISFDIGYLYLRGKTLSVQSCSIATRFMKNSLSVTGIVDAVDRYIAIFGRKPLRIRWIFLLYCLFPLIGICGSIYDVFISTNWITSDMICLITRSSSTLQDILLVIQWITILTAMVFYLIIYRKLAKHTKMLKLLNPDLMTQERYYRDKQVVKLFFFSCSLPIFLVLPNMLVHAVNDLFGIRHRMVTLLSWVLLDLAIPFIWVVYLVFVPSIKNRARDLCNCAPQVTNVSAFTTPAQSSTAI
ncbi:hypothetical protein WR25_08666 [Diploscapter pachys]|uniref:G-protein coupled receptors family 1 profile domain-containing protein n=1 Tax=Diploscapter pachys TaxID=2018661 RepID=A0A2A2LNT6_9BILA|nr:hypothetical protein WR25_08666 [Diploscapter pachys]